MESFWALSSRRSTHSLDDDDVVIVWARFVEALTKQFDRRHGGVLVEKKQNAVLLRNILSPSVPILPS